MTLFFNAFLFIHILAGSLGLLTGTLAVSLKKGDQRHKKIGKLFVLTMLTSGFSSFVLSILHANYFLFMVGVFTVYMVATGNRYILLKVQGADPKPKRLDWILMIFMLISGLVLIGLGIWFLISSNTFGWVFISFGSIGLFFVKADWENYTGKSKFKNYWLLAHIARMTGGYIASVTAFFVVNIRYAPFEVPQVLAWLLPTIVLTPFIVVWSRKHAILKAASKS